MPEPNPATQDSQNPTPLFDMSKAQPIPQTQSAPLFDMSKAQPIQGASQQTGEVLPADVAARHARSVADARSRGLRTDLPDDEDFMDKLRTGVGKEAVSTVSGLANLANKALPSSVQIPTEQSQIARTLPEGPLKQQQLAAAKNELTPHGVGENVGATAENVVEWMGGEEALKGLGLGAKLAKMKKVADFVEEYPRMAKLLHIGSNIAKSSAIGAAQGAIKESSSGGEGTLAGAESGATGGAIGGVVAEAAPVVTQKLGSVLEKYAPDFMNSLMRAKKGSFLYGKNPGQAIIDEGINAPKSLTLAGQLENIHGQLDAAGESLDSKIKQTLSQPSVAAKKQDIVPFIKGTIEDAKQNVVNQTGLDAKAYLAELNKLEENILTKYNTAGESLGQKFSEPLSPSDISDVKKSIGKSTQWRVARDDPQFLLKVDMNKVRQKLYGGLKEMVENAAEEGAPGSKIGDLNARYANVIEAQGLLENRIAQEHGSGGWAAAVRKGEWAGALTTLLSGHPATGAAWLASRAARSAPARVLEARGGAAVGKAMQSPVVGQIAQVVKPAVAAGTRAVEKDDEGTKPNKNAGSTTGPTAKLADQDTSDWRHIQTSDGKHYKIHPADLAEAQRRDAQLKILDQP